MRKSFIKKPNINSLKNTVVMNAPNISGMFISRGGNHIHIYEIGKITGRREIHTFYPLY